MIAVRQIVKVENHQVTIDLPADFPAQEVEVIVLPAPVKGASNGVDQAAAAIQRILSWDTSTYTEEQKAAYARTAAILRKWLQTRQTPFLGAFSGLVTIADDFDAPLPDEIIDLFYADNLASPTTRATS
jgi:hypothetical protein